MNNFIEDSNNNYHQKNIGKKSMPLFVLVKVVAHACKIQKSGFLQPLFLYLLTHLKIGILFGDALYFGSEIGTQWVFAIFFPCFFQIA